MFTHKCEMCGNEFQTTLSRVKYCSSCYDKMQIQSNCAYEEKKESGAAIKIENKQIHPICGKTFTVASNSQKYFRDYTPTRKKSPLNREYIKGHFDYIRVNVPKGGREKIRKYARSQGMSVGELILTALKEYKANHGREK